MNIRHKHPNRSGFTLVELAIVITIIGILIGGVLKGQQLIDQARLAATINQVNNYRSALMIFKTTYNELPGDMLDPDARIVGCSGCKATTSTQGNGFIGGGELGNDLDKTGEGVRYWLHLSKADMISGVTDAALTSEPNGVGTTFPAAKIGGGFIVETAGNTSGGELCGSGWAEKLWGGCQPSPGAVLMIHDFRAVAHIAGSGNSMVMTVSQAANVDRKMDDGKPLTGDVRGASRSAHQGCADANEVYPEAETNSDYCTLGFLIQQ